VRYCGISILFLIVVLIGFSCKNRGSKGISEGEIHYKIEYGGNLGRVPKEALPKTLVVYFKQNKVLFEMTSVFSNSGIINLSNPDEKIYDTYFNFFALKYYSESSEGELFPGFDAMEGIEINKTSKTMVICGFNCLNAEVTLPSDRNKIMNIWYTQDIDVENSNISTPFKEIDGVLMDFFFYFGETEIYFSAESVYSKTINDNIFARRSKYSKVSREDINKLINNMISR
jgi:hypothetical protein